MEITKATDRFDLMLLLLLSLTLTALLFFVEEGRYSLEFLTLNNDTYIWLSFAVIFWGISIGVLYLIQKLKLSRVFSLLLTIILGFLPVYTLICLCLFY